MLTGELSASQIEALSSVYLNEGIRQERWKIDQLELEEQAAKAVISIHDLFAPAVEGGFHLTPYLALEFCSQIAIIHANAWAGYEEKTKEVYMRECGVKIDGMITRPTDIQIDMKIPKMRKIGNSVFSLSRTTVTDGKGAFHVMLKGIM